MPKLKGVIAGLDVGSSKVACCVGEYEEGVTNVLGLGLSPCSGLRRGIVIDIEETVSAISACLEETERMAGVPIEHTLVAVGGSHLDCVGSKGVIAVSRADGEITEKDTERVLEAARAVSLPPNREILHVIPRMYIVDGQEGIKDPVGMSGVRLEVEAHVIGVATSAVKNLTKCIFQAGLEIDELVFAPLASSKLLLSKKQKEMGVILVDLGAGTTSLAVFEEGDILHSAVLPLGSLHITNDIAIGLRTSLEVAEKVKLKYGSCNPQDVAEKEMIDLPKIEKTEEGEVSKKYVCEIIEARVSEIFSQIKDELRKIGRDGMLPAGIVLTGGGSKLQGLVDLAKESLKLPAQIGLPALDLQSEIGGMVDKLDNPMYSTCVGLMLWGTEVEKGITFPKISKITSRISNWFKQFLP